MQAWVQYTWKYIIGCATANGITFIKKCATICTNMHMLVQLVVYFLIMLFVSNLKNYSSKATGRKHCSSSKRNSLQVQNSQNVVIPVNLLVLGCILVYPTLLGPKTSIQ